MRSKFKWILTLLLAFAVQVSFAQEKNISGKVLDNNKEALPGVNIVVKGTKKGTQTDFDGNYSIKANAGETLVFSYIGMKDKEAKVGTSSTINVTMEIESSQLTEIVVIHEGYNRVKTSATTNSAIAKVSSEVLENRPNASFVNSLQGTAAGVTILSSSGSPGSSKISAIIRGVSSLNASIDPLYVIDGVPANASQFRSLNANDFESITILKDASGTSIYGNKGANGVILITTKQAKFGSSLKISYDSSFGVNTLPDNKYNMSNSTELLTIEKRFGVGLGATLTDAQIANYGINTDWKEVFFGKDIMSQHNLGVSFGTNTISNFTSLSYFEQGGLVPTTDFKRVTLRNNFNAKSNDEKFTLGSQIALAYSKRNQLDQEGNSGVNNNTIQNPLHGSVMAMPYVAPNQYASGQDLFNAIGTNFSGANDTYVLEDILKPNSLPSWYNETAIFANIVVSYKLTDNLNFTNKSGVEYKVNDRVFARSPWSYLSIAVRQGNGSEFGGFERMSNERDFSFTNIASLNYSKTFGEKHKINIGLYNEYSKSHYLFKFQHHDGLNPLNYSPGAGTGYVPFNAATPNFYISTATASKIDAGTLSYFLTADYDFSEKYGLDLVLRRDATYRFIDDFKWGTFWSVSGRWNIDKEKFMEGSIFSMLKLRASLGLTGNQNISQASPGVNPLLTSYNNVRDINATGQGYNNEGGIFVSQIANKDIRWEEISQINVGVDFELLKNKLSGSLDVYEKSTSKLFSFVDRSAVTGLYSQSGNNGEIQNKGIELLLRYKIVSNDNLKATVYANGAYNKSKVVSYSGDDSGNSVANLVGGVVYQWNLIPYAGVNASNGNLLFYDINGNVTENPDQLKDRRPMDKSYLPVYQGGFGFNVDYHNFYMDTHFSWTKESWRYDNQLRWAYDVNNIGDDNVSADLLNAWTPTNISDFPSLTATNTTLDSESDRYLYDSSFLRLKNLAIGYNFPTKFLENTFIKNLKLYVQGENVLTWTKWRGFEPESLTATYVTGYPNPRTITFGASVGF